MSGPLSSSSGGSIQGPNYDMMDVTDVLKNKAFNTAIQQQLGLTDSLQSGAGLADKGHELHTYNSQADQPTLSSYTSQVRMALISDNTEYSQALSDAFSALLQEIPPQIGLRLLQDMQKPANERNPLYVGLQGTLETHASLNVWAEGRVGKGSSSTSTLSTPSDRIAASYSQDSLNDEPPAATSNGTISETRRVVNNQIGSLNADGKKTSLSEVMAKIAAIIQNAEETQQKIREKDSESLKQKAKTFQDIAENIVTTLEYYAKRLDELKTQGAFAQFFTGLLGCPPLPAEMFMNKADAAFYTRVNSQIAQGGWAAVANALFMDELRGIAIPTTDTTPDIDPNSDAGRKMIAILILSLIMSAMGSGDVSLQEMEPTLRSVLSSTPPSLGKVKNYMESYLNTYGSGKTSATQDISSSPINGPASLSEVPPSQLQAQAAANMSSVLSGLRKNLEAELSGLSANSTASPSLANYLKQIAEQIDQAQKYLRNIQASDAEGQSKNAVAIRELSTNQLQGSIDLAAKAAEARKKQETMSIMWKVMGPIMAVAMTAATIFSGGASAVSIGISVAMVGVAIADSATGFMSKAVDGLMKDIEESVKANGGSEAGAQAAAIITTLLMVAVLAAATYGAGAKLGTSIVTKKVGEEAGMQAASKVATSVALQVSTTLLSSSQVLSKMFKQIGMACGEDSSTADIVAKVLEVVTVMALFIYSGRALSGVAKSELFSQAMRNAMQALTMTADAAQVGISTATAVMHFQLASLALDKADIESAITEFQTALDVMTEGRKKVGDNMTKLGESMGDLAELFNSILAQEKRIATAISRT